MKSKKIQRKLDLNKQTIASLGKEEMSGVQAGGPPMDFTPFISIMVRCPGVANEKVTQTLTK